MDVQIVRDFTNTMGRRTITFLYDGEKRVTYNLFSKNHPMYKHYGVKSCELQSFTNGNKKYDFERDLCGAEFFSNGKSLDKGEAYRRVKTWLLSWYKA